MIGTAREVIGIAGCVGRILCVFFCRLVVPSGNMFGLLGAVVFRNFLFPRGVLHIAGIRSTEHAAVAGCVRFVFCGFSCLSGGGIIPLRGKFVGGGLCF